MRKFLLKNKQNILFYFGIYLIIYIAFVINNSDLGFYEDDYVLIVDHMNNWSQHSRNFLFEIWTGWPQGRVLSWSTPLIAGVIAHYLGGKTFLYLLISIVHLANFITFRMLLKLIFNSNLISLLGGFILVFYPADTTHTLLCHGLHLHYTLSFLCLGAIAYKRGYKFVPYIFLFLILVSYEQAMPIFLLIPLLFMENLKNLMKHLLKSAIVIGVIIFLRAVVKNDEDRINFVLYESGRAFDHVVYSLKYGPLTAIKSLYVPFVEWKNSQFWDWGMISWHAGLAIVLLTLSFFLYAIILEKKIKYLERKKTVYYFFLGLICVYASYLTSLIHNPNALQGRLTSVHFTSSFGVALSFLSLISFLRIRKGVFVLIFTLISIFPLYHYNIQNDFIKSWGKQKKDIKTILSLIPEDPKEEQKSILFKQKQEGRFILSSLFAAEKIFHIVTDYKIGMIKVEESFNLPAKLIEKDKSLFIRTSQNLSYAIVNFDIPISKENTYYITDEFRDKKEDFTVFKLVPNNGVMVKSESKIEGNTYKIKLNNNYQHFKQLILD